MKLVVFIMLTVFLWQTSVASEGIARAYIIDGVNGTRSGPIRNENLKDKLEFDLRFLVKHAQTNEYSSGIAKPSSKFWTALPEDSIFNKNK